VASRRTADTVTAAHGSSIVVLSTPGHLGSDHGFRRPPSPRAGESLRSARGDLFALPYWELDGGGPRQPSHEASRCPDLAFPRTSTAAARPGWRPVFYEYVYLGFTNAVAFSPTDVMPLAHWAKSTMGLESLTSITILSLVIGRAVNILG